MTISIIATQSRMWESRRRPRASGEPVPYNTGLPDQVG